MEMYNLKKAGTKKKQHVSWGRRCVAVAISEKRLCYVGPMEDVTKTELPALPHDTPPHTFYNHSSFLG